MLKKAFLAVGLACITALSLSSCTVFEADSTAAKFIDQTCKNEPPLYASFVIVAAAKNASAATMAKAEAAHVTITEVCKAPPANIGEASIIVAKAYAEFIRINALYDKERSSS